MWVDVALTLLTRRPMQIKKAIGLALALALSAGIGCADATSSTNTTGESQLTSANALDGVYLRMDLLASDEKAELDRLVDTGVLKEQIGQFAIIFPDDRIPIAGPDAEAMIRSGAVNTFSFSGLPNSLLGSMSLGKYAAITNQVPVVAVHTGWGNSPDMGVQSQGPKAFFIERPSNKSPAPYDDDAITPIRDLIVALDPASVDGIHLIGYCLGAYKAANITKWIAVKQPALLAKVDVAIFGVGVVTAPGIRNLYQEGGNLDTFGRINSTAILADDLVPGRFHPLRNDVPTGLPMVALDEAWKKAAWVSFLEQPESALDDDGLSKIEAATGIDLATINAKLSLEAKQIPLMQIEVATSAGLPTDEIHEYHLRARATGVELAQYILASLAQGKSVADVKADAHVQELRGRIDAYVATALRVDSERTPASDTYEYNVYKERIAAAAAAIQDAGSD
jgi:hypothetical protein